MAKKRKTLPKNFDKLIEAGDIAALKQDGKLSTKSFGSCSLSVTLKKPAYKR